MIFPEISSIKTRRQRLGLKQNNLAEISGVSQSLIAKIENGITEPSYFIIKKIFNALEQLEHKEEKKCSDVMTKNIISIKSKDKIGKASELMKKNSISQLPVIDGRLVTGTINESLILNKLMTGINQKKLFQMPVKEIADEPLPIIRADSPLSIIFPLIKNSGAVLLTNKKEIVGIITKANLI